MDAVLVPLHGKILPSSVDIMYYSLGGMETCVRARVSTCVCVCLCV